MYTAIKGIYENGEVFLEEAPPTKQRVSVIVTFMEEKPKSTPLRQPGSLLKLGVSQGKTYTLPDNFNDPLEELKDYME
jgi:hypothetical protein